VVRPWRWAWAGEGWGQGPTGATGPWLLHQELGAAGGHSASRRRHLVWAVVPPRLPLASPPLALRRPPLAAGPPVRFQSVCPCKPTAACCLLPNKGEGSRSANPTAQPEYQAHNQGAPPFPARRDTSRGALVRRKTRRKPPHAKAAPPSSGPGCPAPGGEGGGSE
jgi:hypothetical protein